MFFSGLYFVYLFRLTTNSKLELMFCSPQFQGVFLASKGYTGPFTSPKVSISPHGKHVAVLDLTGRVDLFNLDSERYHLSPTSENYLASASKGAFHEILDISWWTDHILILANMKGDIFMYNIVSGERVIHNDPVFCMPAIQIMKHCQEHVFILESRASLEHMSSSEHIEEKDSQDLQSISSLDGNKHENLWWRLISLCGKSVSEMYSVLISNQQYESALEFASRHRLDKNEVLKEQWAHSDQGIHEINVLLPQITDKIFILSQCLDKVGPTEDIVKALLSLGLHITDEYKFLDLEDGDSSALWDFHVIRLQLLQYRDKLETFVGINMGRCVLSSSYRRSI